MLGENGMLEHKRKRGLEGWICPPNTSHAKNFFHSEHEKPA